MGFLKSIKDKLGIGGVSVTVQAPGQIARASELVEGKVILTTKSDQDVLDIEVKLIEEYNTGRGDEKKKKEFTLGQVKINGGFTIKTGETKEIPFSLPFKIINSNADDLKEMGGSMG